MAHVIFDLDGTLANSGSYEEDFVATCSRVDIGSDRARHFWHRHQGLPLRQQLINVTGLAEDNRLIDELTDTFWQRIGDRPFIAVAGADQLLRHLHHRGYRLFLTTGSIPSRLNQCLDQLGWQDYFLLAQGSTANNYKGPDHYQKMAAALDLTLPTFAAEAIMIGDGAYDMSSALGAEIGTRIGLIPTTAPIGQRQLLIDNGATTTVSNLGEISALIDS